MNNQASKVLMSPLPENKVFHNVHTFTMIPVNVSSASPPGSNVR